MCIVKHLTLTFSVGLPAKINYPVPASQQVGEGGHSRTRGTVVFFDLFKMLKTLNFNVFMPPHVCAVCLICLSTDKKKEM